MTTARRLAGDPATWIAVACGLGFLLLAVVVNGQGYVGFDEPGVALVRGLPVPADGWAALTTAGGIVVLPIGAALVAWLVLTRHYRLAVIVAVALLAASLGTELVKLLVARPRPPGEPLAPATGYSFPSGHTLNSTVTYGLVALVAWRSGLPPAARRAIVAALVALIVGVGLSRIALGVHYPSDVLAGWLAGTSLVAGAVAVLRLTDGGPAPPGGVASAGDAAGSEVAGGTPS